MKKVLTSLFVGLCSLAALATNYTGNLTIIINGEDADPMPDQTITVNPNGNGYDLTIDYLVGVGRVNVVGIPATTGTGGMKVLAVNKIIQIEEVEEGDLGPMLGYVPINMVARFVEDWNYFITDLDIIMVATGETIHVNFETANATEVQDAHFQFPNHDFEEWTSFNCTTTDKYTEGTTYSEPKRWHGFGSASGSFAGTAKKYPKLAKDNGREGHGYCAKATSGYALIAVANGSISTGRFNAGGMSTTSTSNYSYSKGSDTKTDVNGDKFYMAMPNSTKPDAIKFWMKYSPNGTNDGSQASFSALVFNGVEIRDPENNSYAANKAGQAKKTDITATEWTEYSVDFSYVDGKDAAAILITASTSSKPGGGQDGDIIWLDDVELVYRADVSNIVMTGVNTNEGFSFNAATHEYNLTYSGNAQTVTAENFTVAVDGLGATAVKNVEDLGNGTYKVAIAAVSADLTNYAIYSINISRVETLDEAIAEGGNEAITLADDLYVADINYNDFTIVATDGNGNWIELLPVGLMPFDVLSGAPAIVGTTVYGTISNNNTNPLMTLNATPTPDYEAEPFADFATYDLAHAETFQPHANEVAFVEGYMDNNGKLRGWSGEEGAQGMSLDLDLSRYEGDTNFTKGEHMKFFGVFKLKEAWSGAPRRIAADDPDYFDNLTLVVTDGGENNPTAIDTVATAKTVEAVRYINVAGKQSARPFDGVNIVVTRYTDGTTQVSKVVK